jgi:hypothetical protein
LVVPWKSFARRRGVVQHRRAGLFSVMPARPAQAAARITIRGGKQAASGTAALPLY